MNTHRPHATPPTPITQRHRPPPSPELVATVATDPRPGAVTEAAPMAGMTDSPSVATAPTPAFETATGDTDTPETATAVVVSAAGGQAARAGIGEVATMRPAITTTLPAATGARSGGPAMGNSGHSRGDDPADRLADHTAEGDGGGCEMTEAGREPVAVVVLCRAGRLVWWATLLGAAAASLVVFALPKLSPLLVPAGSVVAEPAGGVVGAAVLAQGRDPGAISLTQFLTNVRNVLIGLLAALTVCYLTIGGIRMIIAQGEPSEVERAKAALRSGVWGFFATMLAPAFVAILNAVFGR